MPGNTQCKQDSGRSPVKAHARIPRFFSQWAFHPRPSPSMGDASRGGGRGESSSAARPPRMKDGRYYGKRKKRREQGYLCQILLAMDGSLCRQQ